MSTPHVQEVSAHVGAPPERVYEVWSRVEEWPGWTESVTAVEVLEGPPPLQVGTRVRLRQPRLPIAVWTVTGVAEGHWFSWTSGTRGLRTLAIHRVEPEDDGSRVVARIEQSGPLSGIVGMLLGGLVRRYLDLEVAGLSSRSQG